jgi:hypothetical protein
MAQMGAAVLHTVSVRTMPWLRSTILVMAPGTAWSEAGPAAAGVELGVGVEQLVAAADAVVAAIGPELLVFAGEGRSVAAWRVTWKAAGSAPLPAAGLATRRVSGWESS